MDSMLFLSRRETTLRRRCRTPTWRNRGQEIVISRGLIQTGSPLPIRWREACAAIAADIASQRRGSSRHFRRPLFASELVEPPGTGVLRHDVSSTSRRRSRRGDGRRLQGTNPPVRLGHAADRCPQHDAPGEPAALVVVRSCDPGGRQRAPRPPACGKDRAARHGKQAVGYGEGNRAFAPDRRTARSSSPQVRG